LHEEDFASSVWNSMSRRYIKGLEGIKKGLKKWL